MNIGSDEAIKLFELGEKISISIEIPNDLQAQNRSYKIIRIHNGITEIIDGEYDSDTGLFVFETDLFSTYALIYIDEITPEAEVLDEKTNEIPKTGVTTNITGLFILSIISAVALVSRKKKDTHI